jgi:hypothetical protein
MSRYQRTVLACLCTARDDLTFWSPFSEPKEKRAVRELETLGLVVVEEDREGRCLWAAPTRTGLRKMRENAGEAVP